MTDSPELAAIRRRMMAGWPVDTNPFKDRIALLRILDETLKERAEARAEIQRLNMEMTAYREKLTPADAAALKAMMDALYAEKNP